MFGRPKYDGPNYNDPKYVAAELERVRTEPSIMHIFNAAASLKPINRSLLQLARASQILLDKLRGKEIFVSYAPPSDTPAQALR
jgi:hypothetical protein